MTFTPEDIASLRNPRWLEVIEIGRQTGMTAASFAAALQRIADSPEPLADVESLQAIGVALWLLSRREGEPRDYPDWVADLTLDDMLEMLPSAPGPAAAASGNRAARRRAPKAAAAGRGRAKTTT